MPEELLLTLNLSPTGRVGKEEELQQCLGKMNEMGASFLPLPRFWGERAGIMGE